MTAKKAYELLKQLHVESVAHPRTDLFIAYRIALESLKFFLFYLCGMPAANQPRLPSEEPQ